MNAWKGAALAAALVAAVGMGAAVLPPAQAQTPTKVTPRVTPRAVEIMGGRGSQIGVTIRDVEESDAKTAKLAAASGVVIEEVSEESPAARAGLKKGDVVVEFDGERVRSVRQFTRLVQETPAGRKAQTSVMRDGQKLNLTIEPRESNTFNYFGDGAKLSVLQDFAGGFALICRRRLVRRRLPLQRRRSHRLLPRFPILTHSSGVPETVSESPSAISPISWPRTRHEGRRSGDVGRRRLGGLQGRYQGWRCHHVIQRDRRHVAIGFAPANSASAGWR